MLVGPDFIKKKVSFLKNNHLDTNRLQLWSSQNCPRKILAWRQYSTSGIPSSVAPGPGKASSPVLAVFGDLCQALVTSLCSINKESPKGINPWDIFLSWPSVVNDGIVRGKDRLIWASRHGVDKTKPSFLFCCFFSLGRRKRTRVKMSFPTTKILPLRDYLTPRTWHNISIFISLSFSHVTHSNVLSVTVSCWLELQRPDI